MSDRWGAPESVPDPEWFVRFLDRTSTQPGERHPALALLGLRGDGRCLDAGCGVGEDARAIADLTGATRRGDRSERPHGRRGDRPLGGPDGTGLRRCRRDAPAVRGRDIRRCLVDATRRVLARRVAGYASPWVGRQLRGLLLAAGLRDVRVAADCAEFTDLAAAERVLRLQDLARAVLAPEDAARWEEDLRARDAAGRFACYGPWFVACGRTG